MKRLCKRMRKMGAFARGRLCAVAIFSVVFCSVLYTLTLRTNAVFIRDGEEVKKIITLRDHPAEILEDEGIDTHPEDLVKFTGFKESEAAEIDIKRAFVVKVQADGETHQLQMAEGSVGDALEEAGVTLSEDDRISLDPSAPLEEDTEISVARVQRRQVEQTEEIPYATIEKQTPLLKEGQVRVTRWGQSGEKKCVYEETWIDGELTAREPVEETVLSQPVAETVIVGADVPVSPQPVEVDGSGEPLQYERVITGAVATAYSARPGAWTASGFSAVAGTVAVDPNVIPYGTKLYIATPDFQFVYGYAVAADTGTAIRDGIIDVDLFFNTYLESCLFGKRTVNIYVLETPGEPQAMPVEIGSYPLDADTPAG